MAEANCHSPLVNSYSRLPVTFKRGEGARLWDSEDNEYLDALGGIAVCALGHAHPTITDAITQQAQTLLHTSNLFGCLLYTSPSPRDLSTSRMPSSA